MYLHWNINFSKAKASSNNQRAMPTASKIKMQCCSTTIVPASQKGQGHLPTTFKGGDSRTIFEPLKDNSTETKTHIDNLC